MADWTAVYWVEKMVNQMGRLMVDWMAASMALQTAVMPVEEMVV
jgi:hypothetical protein